MLKQVYAPSLDRHVKFGRTRPDPNSRKMHLRNYLDLGTLPPAPATCDYMPKGMASISKIMCNDTLGDCVIAGYYHIKGVATGNAGTIVIPTDAQVVADYGKIGGYVPGDDSTDQGCDEQAALNYWCTNGDCFGVKPLAWLAVDATNKTELMQALFLFENLYFGVELPDKWVNPFPSANNFTWGVAGAADPQNGHCFIGGGYDSKGIKIGTWGMEGTLLWSAVTTYAVAKNGGEIYVILTPDMLAKGQAKAPNGIAWADIIADFNALGGHAPVPVPPPAPTPPTPPAPTVTTHTLAEVQALLAKGW